MASRRTSPAAGPLDDDDLLDEILLRLPPHPSSLLRASLVCKRWMSVTTAAAFRRRFRICHRNPPILGVFEEFARELRFMPLLDPPDRIPSERFSLDLSADESFSWTVLGCRHGRVLLIDRERNLLLVFEPVSGDTLRILIPPEFVRDEFTATNGAVLCAAGSDRDHVHGDCHSSPFKVVLVATRKKHQPAVARVYSSATGIWESLVSTPEPGIGYVDSSPCTLVGASLGWCVIGYKEYGDGILEFDLDKKSLTLISMPLVRDSSYTSRIIRGEDGGFGLAILRFPSFQLWDRKVDCHGVATWVLRKAVNMDSILSRKANSAHVAGYAEDADAIFMSMYYGESYINALSIVQLDTMMVKECRGGFSAIYHPLTNFYTAGTARA